LGWLINLSSFKSLISKFSDKLVFILLNLYMEKLVSIWDNSLWYRLFVLVVWLWVLFWLNYFLFSYVIGHSFNLWLIVWWVFLSVIFWYLLKYSKYKYVLEKESLYIKTPSREYKIPLIDIKRVGIVQNIPLVYKIWQKFDHINKILYLCGFSDKWIALDVSTHTIVICPRKFNEFYERLK